MSTVAFIWEYTQDRSGKEHSIMEFRLNQSVSAIADGAKDWLRWDNLSETTLREKREDLHARPQKAEAAKSLAFRIQQPCTLLN